MAHSDVSICNISLARLGNDSIRSFSTDTKRAALCQQFYPHVRDTLLSKYDWAFAKRLTKLTAMDQEEATAPDGIYVYQLPTDCKSPKDIYPEGSRQFWEVRGTRLYCKASPEEGVYLYYTSNTIPVATFSEPFVNLLALGLAVRLCMPLTQDTGLYKVVQEEYRTEQFEAWEADANIGSEYRATDDDPEHDTFVNPVTHFESR